MAIWEATRVTGPGLPNPEAPLFAGPDTVPSLSGTTLTYYPLIQEGVTTASTSTLTTTATEVVSTSNQTFNDLIFPNGVSISNGVINTTFNRCYFGGPVAFGSGDPAEPKNTVLNDCEIVGNYSVGDNDSPVAVGSSDYTINRCSIHHSAHGCAIRNNNVIKWCYFFDCGGNTNAHKDGVYSGGGQNVEIRHTQFDWFDGPLHGVTSAIGLLGDFEVQSGVLIDSCLLNSGGAYSFYGSGGPQKPFAADHVVFTNNFFGTKYSDIGGQLGPVTYFDVTADGNVWDNNTWYDGPNAGQTVDPVY